MEIETCTNILFSFITFEGLRIMMAPLKVNGLEKKTRITQYIVIEFMIMLLYFHKYIQVIHSFTKFDPYIHAHTIIGVQCAARRYM